MKNMVQMPHKLCNSLKENVQEAKQVLYTDDNHLLIIEKDKSDLQHETINVIKELEIYFKKSHNKY
jgi:hypothetical protein